MEELNEKQEKWINEKESILRKWIDTYWPLDDQKWKIVIEKVAIWVDSSKQNPIVRKRFLDLLEEYELKEKKKGLLQVRA